VDADRKGRFGAILKRYESDTSSFAGSHGLCPSTRYVRVIDTVSISALSLMFLGGVAVGSMFNLSSPLYAQGAKGPVYGIYEANVTDAEGYKSKFLSLITRLEKNGIKYLARGGETKSLSALRQRTG
jgi:hypothetical protein